VALARFANIGLIETFVAHLSFGLFIRPRVIDLLCFPFRHTSFGATNPGAVYRVQLRPDGTIADVKLTRGSGRRLPFLSNKAKIETSVPIGVRDEEVKVHRKSDCGYFGRR